MTRYTTTDVVWLETLRGATLEQAWQASMRNAGHYVSRKYVACIRHELNRAIQRQCTKQPD